MIIEKDIIDISRSAIIISLKDTATLEIKVIMHEGPSRTDLALSLQLCHERTNFGT